MARPRSGIGTGKLAAITVMTMSRCWKPRALANRIFSRWAMARVSEDGEADIPLITHVDGLRARRGPPDHAGAGVGAELPA